LVLSAAAAAGAATQCCLDLAHFPLEKQMQSDWDISPLFWLASYTCYQSLFFSALFISPERGRRNKEFLFPYLTSFSFHFSFFIFISRLLAHFILRRVY
jgi:hypothetical protein